MEETQAEKDAGMKLARARAAIRAKAPYLMKTVYALIPVWVPGLKTLGVTRGLVMAVDAEWFAKITDNQAAGALVHESFHIINKHPERMDAMPDRELANIAGDLWINQMIRIAGWELPHGVFPEDYGFPEGLILEEYYQLLVKRKQAGLPHPKQSKQKNKGGQNTQQGQGNGGQQGGGPQDQKAQGQGSGGQGGQQPTSGQKPGGGAGTQKGQGQPGQGAGNSPGQGPPQQGQGGAGSSNLPAGKELGVCAGRCGSAGGNPLFNEKQLDEKYGRSEADHRRIVKQTQSEIQAHAAQHGRGSVPGGLLENLEVLQQKHEIRWQDELAHVMKKCTGRLEAGGMDYSLARPSKRSHARGFPRPGLVQYQPEVCLVLDTSASMGKKQIVDCLVEAIGILKTLGIDQATFIQADTKATKPVRIRIRDLMGNLKIHGRGGTDFDAALRAAEKSKPKPDMIVYLTDGDGGVSYRPKGIEVVWCVIRNHWNRKPPCDWGHCVIVADKGKDKEKRLPSYSSP